MAHRPTLAEFVGQELQLAAAVFAGLADNVLAQWRNQAPSRLASDMDAMRVLHQHRGEFVQHALQSMREQTQRRTEGPAMAHSRPGRLELSLVDDDEITADIEVARVVERANSELEEPLRELRTYTSALVGDVNTARDTNPLRPEVWVRALMAAARGVPISRGMQIALLRGAAMPLIEALRDAYGAGCARLQAQGVAPAQHRTIVNEGVATELTEAMRAKRALERGPDFDPYLTGPRPREAPSDVPEAVLDLLQRMEQGLNTQPPTDASVPHPYMPGSAAPHESLPPSLSTPATVGAGGEQHTVEHLSQLYDAILSDRRLPRESLPLLSRLYPAVLRQALAEPDLMHDAGHPVWRFMDHLAFLMQTRAVGDAKANIAFAQGLVEQLVAHHGPDAKPFQTAADRLAVLDRQRFARAVAAAAPDVALLSGSQRGAGDAVTSVPQSLDAGSLDSSPAPLLRRGGDGEPTSSLVVNTWRAGSWLSLFLRSQWRRALILWRAPNAGPLLLLDANEARHWALRPAAVDRLAAAGLARSLTPRSLMSDAVGRIGQVTRDPGPTLFG